MCATAIDVATLVLLVRHGEAIPLAAFCGAAAGAATCFTLNKYVAFRDRSPISLGQVARFNFVAVVAAVLLAAAVKLATARLGVHVVAAKFACAPIVFALWTYPAQRRLVFTRGAEVA